MNELGVLAVVGGALLLGAMSPGPSFLVTARMSLSRSRRAGLFTALGIGLGGVLFAGLALGGLIALLAAVEPLYVALKAAGGLYLLWLAFKIWRGARSPLPQKQDQLGAARQRLTGHPLVRGLTVQLSNPKTAIVYGSVFASLVPQSPSPMLYPALLAVVFVVEFGWYALVAVGMSLATLRSGYQRAKKWVDRLAAAVLAALGIRLITIATSHSI